MGTEIREIFRPRAEEDTVARARRITAALPVVTLRIGGGARDAYNLQNRIWDYQTMHGNARRALEFARRAADPTTAVKRLEERGEKQGDACAQETLMGMAALIDGLLPMLEAKKLRNELFEHVKNPWYSRFPGDENNPEDQARFRTEIMAMITDTLTRLETAYISGLEIGITPDRIAHDGLQAQVAADSPTYRYLDSFLSPQSYLRRIFLTTAP